MEEVYQHPRDCVFCHFFGKEESTASFTPKNLTIVKQTKFTHSPFTVEAAIIGESDFVIITHDKYGIIFVELLACVNPEQHGLHPATSMSFEQKDQLHAKKGNNFIEFAAHATIHPPTKDRARLMPSKAEIYLEQSFPGKMTPRTIVSVGMRQLTPMQIQMEIQSLHEYDIDGQIVPLTSHTFVHRLPLMVPAAKTMTDIISPS